jgi:hypothetical protein
MTVVALRRGLAGDSTYSAERLAVADNTTIDGKM